MPYYPFPVRLNVIMIKIDASLCHSAISTEDNCQIAIGWESAIRNMKGESTYKPYSPANHTMCYPLLIFPFLKWFYVMVPACCIY